MNLRANPNNFIAIAIAVILFAIGFALNVLHLKSINSETTANAADVNTLPAATDHHALNAATNKAPGISDTESAE